MAVLKLMVIFTTVAIASASPDALQRLYGTPTDGTDHHLSHGHSGASDAVSDQSILSNVDTILSPDNTRRTINNVNRGQLSRDQEPASFSAERRLEEPLKKTSLAGRHIFSNATAEPSQFGTGKTTSSDNMPDIQTDGPFFPDSIQFPDSPITDQISSGSESLHVDGSTSHRVDLSPSVDFESDSKLTGGFGSNSKPDITITRVVTIDIFNTVSNIFYNSIPVTLTQFVKTTLVASTVQIVTTAVDDNVFVATAPVTRTDTVTVTDTNTAHQYATEVSTDFYTITHRIYDIQQQLVNSTVVQTQVFRPTVVSTRIDTEYETETVLQTVTNTVVISSRAPFPGSSTDFRLSSQQGVSFPGNAGPRAFDVESSFDERFVGHLTIQERQRLLQEREQEIMREQKILQQSLLEAEKPFGHDYSYGQNLHY